MIPSCFERRSESTIHGMYEYTYRNVRFLLRYVPDSDLCCFFSAFSRKGGWQNYNYIKASLSLKGSAVYFLDSDSPPSDPRGTYFLGDKSLAYLRDIRDIITSLVPCHKLQQVRYYGSSKGASGAILAALEVGAGTAIVNAPQIRIGSYCKVYHSSAIDFLGLDIARMNQVICERLSPLKQVSLIISCGTEDDHHISLHILPFLAQLVENKISAKFFPISGGHDGVSLEWYSRFINLSFQESIDYTSVAGPARSSFLSFYEKYSNHSSFEAAIPCLVHLFSDGCADSLFSDDILLALASYIDSSLDICQVSQDLRVVVPKFDKMRYCIYLRFNEKIIKFRYQVSELFHAEGESIAGLRSVSVFYRTQSGRVFSFRHQLR